MSTCLRALVDDHVCQFMCDSIPKDGVANVYAENHEDATEEVREYEEEMEDNLVGDEVEDEDLHPLSIVRVHESEEHVGRDIALGREFYSSPRKGNQEAREANGDDVSDTDSDYIAGDSCSSGDDEETTEIYRKFRTFKKKLKRGEATNLDDVIYEGVASIPENKEEDLDDGNCTPYWDSSDAESVDELGGVGEGSKYPRFNKKNHVVMFQLGMKFNSKKQFKKAVIKQALDERRVIEFAKDDPKRVRAICDWKGCPWVCLLSNTSRTDSWQISTYDSSHVCPPRKDNKLVTATRIAKKYEKFIFANPRWKP
jgi:alpha-galactosidase